MPTNASLKTGLLLVWIGSFTYSIDIVSELKLYDLIFFVALICFRKQVFFALTSRDGADSPSARPDPVTSNLKVTAPISSGRRVQRPTISTRWTWTIR